MIIADKWLRLEKIEGYVGCGLKLVSPSKRYSSTHTSHWLVTATLVKDLDAFRIEVWAANKPGNPPYNTSWVEVNQLSASTSQEDLESYMRALVRLNYCTGWLPTWFHEMTGYEYEEEA